MIKPEEIRLNNWVLFEGKPRIIYSIDPIREYEDLKCAISLKIFFRNGELYGFDHRWLSQCEPIILNEDVLLKSGFTKSAGHHKIWEDTKLSNFEEIFWIPGIYFLEWDDDHYTLYHADDEHTYWQLMWVRTLHELQNVIFALTKKELEISL